MKDSNIFLECYRIYCIDITSFASALQQGHNIKVVSRVFSAIKSKASRSNEEDVLKEVSAILSKFQKWPDASDPNALDFLISDVIGRLYVSNLSEKMEVIQGHYLVYKRLDILKKKIYLDYLALRGIDTQAAHIQQLIDTSISQYHDQSFKLHSSVVDKHLANNKGNATQKTLQRLQQETTLAVSSVLITNESNLKQGISVVLQAHSVAIESLEESEKNSFTYIFPSDHAFTNPAKQCFFVEKKKSEISTTTKTWQGLEVGLVKENGALTIIHCVPLAKS